MRQIITSRVRQFIFVYFSVSLLASCFSSERMAKMQSEIGEIRLKQQKLDEEVLRISQDLAQMLNFIACPPERSRLKDFLNSCRADGAELCSSQDIEMITNWLITEKHVLLRIPDNAEPDKFAIPPARMVQLRQLFLQPLPSTKLLLFVGAPKSTSENLLSIGNSIQTAQTIRKFIATKSIENSERVRVLSPIILRPETATDIARRYASRHSEDKPLISEPIGSSKTMLVWVFRVDC